MTGKGTDGGDVVISKRTGKPMRACRRLTRIRRDAVLEHIAATCNVRFAAGAVGVSTSAIYQLTRRDAAFREQFADAVQMGYERVEAELLAHALASGAEQEQGEHGPIAVPAFNPDLALKVLQHRNVVQRERRPNGGAPIRRATEREIEDALVSKLKGLAKRLALIP